MENPAFLLGIPVIVVGSAGVLMALAALLGSTRLPGWLLEPMGGQYAPAVPAHEVAAPGERAHPGALEYVGVAVALGVGEALELIVYYLDVLGDASLPILLLLTVVQFAMVAMWYMHLRFDSRVFWQLFVGGLMLAGALFVIVLATLGGSLV